MDVATVFREFARVGPSAFTAVRAVDADREAMLPVLLGAIDDYLNGGASSRTRADHLFIVFHLLGAWRETRAYRPLARLLARPGDELHDLLGDAVTETTHRVMAAVFDGDPQPIYGLILNREADEFVRSRMCELVAMLAVEARLPREEAARSWADASNCSGPRTAMRSGTDGRTPSPLPDFRSSVRWSSAPLPARRFRR